MRQAFVFMFVISAATAAAAQEPAPTFNVELAVPLEARTLKGAPYSADIVNDYTQLLADGNRIVRHSSGRVYRDKDGRVRREEDSTSGSPSISIVDPVAGVSYSLDPERRIAWKTPGVAGMTIVSKLDAVVRAKVEAGLKSRRAGKPAPDTDPPGLDQFHVATGPMVDMGWKTAGGAGAVVFEVNGQVAGFQRFNGRGPAFGDGTSAERLENVEETLAPRVMEGVRAEGRRTKTTIPAGAVGNEWPITITSEEWTSPDLQVLVLTDRKDPRLGDSTYRLTNIVSAEPAASLFQVPADYAVKETGVSRFELPHPQP